ncbi:MAG: hypothetical protein HY898_20925 [Deltaproteobacteria bacterium]|nr:hypothetical protein [Deltaproteobacteria bacterium]
MRHLLLETLIVITGCMWGTVALASPIFPGGINAHLQLSYTPKCGICHAGGMTGYGTVKMPFGIAMRERGLVPENLASLDTALDRMAADKVDSNDNGLPDVEELKMNEDPNAGAAGVVDPPQYGCKVASTRGGQGVGRGMWLAVGLALLARRRSRAGS